MDELIGAFLESYLTDEFREEVERSFALFDFFEYNQAYSSFVDLLNDQSNISSDEMKDRFVNELNDKLDYMLLQHTIKLVDTATTYERNEILTSLAHIQKLEDYTGIIRILESMIDDYETLAIILSDSTLLGKEDILLLIESFDPSMLRTLKQYIYQKEEEAAVSDEVSLNLVDNFKIFCLYAGNKHIGANVLQNGVLIGDRFGTYLPYVQEYLVTPNDVEATALNILSLILLSIDGYNSTLLVYRKYSYQLLQDLNLVSKVEVKVLDHIAKFTEFKKVHHEKIRLSQTSNR